MPDDALDEGRRIHADVRIVGDSRSTVTLQPRAVETDDQALWVAIRNRTEAINFDHYQDFIERLLCHGKTDPNRDPWPPVCRSEHGDGEEKSASQFGSPHISTQWEELGRRPDIYGVDSYYLLKLATRAFLTFEAGVVIKDRRPDGRLELPEDHKHVDEDRLYRVATIQELEKELEHYLTQVGGAHGRALPYLKLIVRNLLTLKEPKEVMPYCEGILLHRFHCPSTTMSSIS
jgi:hypothetical protein